MKSISLVRNVAVLSALACQVGAQQVTNGNFEAGNTGFTSGYTYVSPTPNSIGTETQYTVGKDPSRVSVYGDWQQFGDHTSGSGNMLIANGATAPNTSLWSETVPVLPNSNYVFTYFGATVNSTSGSQTVLQSFVNGTSIGSSVTLPVNGGTFVPITINYFSGLNTTAVLSIVDTNTNPTFNDFAIDDISFTGPSVASTPEPGSLAIIASLGLTGASFLIRRRKRVRKTA